MSFFGNTNNNTSSGFGGGFGASNTGGFGANNNTSTGGGLFGGNTATSGGFGGGGFGSTNNTSSPFGKPASTGFGSTATTTGGGLFGGQTSTSGGFGGGGFGSTNTASTGFGAQQNTGGCKSDEGLFKDLKQGKSGDQGHVTNNGTALFGQNKPATGGFGSNTGGSIFGGGGASSTAGGFGTNTTTTQSNPFASNTGSTGFGATNTNASTGSGFGGFGASNPAPTNNNGTAGTPFQPFSERDAASNQSSLYQSISFQQPYTNKSFEELRVEDYLQGRRYGNTNGQAGSFGQSTGFGGGATSNTTGGSLFGGGNNTNTSTGFGGGFGATQNQTQTTGGFGSTTGGSLFGQNKPATGGLFGNTQASGATTGGFGNTTSGTTGGLFGGGGGSTGFGANNQNQNTGGGLFGSSNQQQPKPAFGGGFGAANTNTSTGFGGSTNTGGGLFGSNTNNNTNTTGGGLFGGNNQQTQQQQSNPFGGSTNTAGGLFGGQNKPATGGGLFGASTNTGNTGGGLFGSNNNQQPQQSGGLFGSNTTNNQQSGGLFGNNNQSKPATGGLFGASTTNTNTGGGLFGGQNNQQQQSGGGLFGGGNTGGSSLFGGNNQNKPAGNSLFGGSTTNTNTGGSLFGGQNNNQQGAQGNSLFGGSLQSNNQQQQNSSSLFGGGGFGGSAQAPQQNQLTASLTMSPYGNDQLFSSLGQSSTPVGPLATPLQGARPAQSKAPSLLSSTRLNSPVYTPRASTFNRGGTYGLQYSSNFTTPGSAYSSSLTPQQSSLLKPTGSLGSALTSKLAKSMSMNNLRGDGTPRDGESLLRPTPGGGSRSFLKSGSMRKLTIDRNMRHDLFESPSEQRQVEPVRGGAEIEGSSLKKRVSFDNTAERESTAEPTEANALVRTEENEEPNALFRSKSGSRSHTNGAPEMQQVNGSPLSSVPENGVPQRPTSAPATNKKPSEKKPAQEDIVVGDYWTKPAIKDLKNMSRAQLAKLGKFTVGCQGLGSVDFGACDLTNTNIDDICGKIVKFGKRSVTVYPDENTKPPRGKGLNVPATIHLQNSYPSDRHHRRKIEDGSTTAYERHVAQLKKLRNTEFVDYDIKSATWTFRVQHFTTYGMQDDSDDDANYEEDEMDVQQESSGLSEPPQDETMQSMDLTNNNESAEDSPQDDTFGHKKHSFPAVQVPGGFEGSEGITYDYDDPSADEGVEDFMMSGGLGNADDDDVFTSKGGAVQPPSPEVLRQSHSSMAYDDIGAVDVAEQMQDELEKEIPGSFNAEEPKFPRSILKPTAGYSTFASPEKLATDSWEEQLQRTMSPKKRDRQALRSIQQSAFQEKPDAVESPFKRSMLGQSTFGQSALGQSYLTQKSAKKVGFGGSTLGGSKNDLGKSQAFRTSMDIMNSLWAQEKSTKKTVGAAAKGFEV